MRILRPICFDEFVAWYLSREHSKGNLRTVPATQLERRVLMEEKEHGKLWPQCASWCWLLVEIDARSELGNLLILASDWTREEKIVRADAIRTLDNAVTHALSEGYFEHWSSRRARHHAYYQAYASAPPSTSEFGRIVLRTLHQNEKDEAKRWVRTDVEFYLHDGLGRSLPYLALMQQQRIPPVTIEAFLAKPNA